jgi:hypothetical protein
MGVETARISAVPSSLAKTDLDNQNANRVPNPQIVSTKIAQRNCAGKIIININPAKHIVAAVGPMLT